MELGNMRYSWAGRGHEQNLLLYVHVGFLYSMEQVGNCTVFIFNSYIKKSPKCVILFSKSIESAILGG